MLALKIRCHLQTAWADLDLTPEEGLRELEIWSVQELIDSDTGQVATYIVPQLNAIQKQLLDALNLQPPKSIREPS